MKHAIPIMAAQGGGSIINISSIAAIRSTSGVDLTFATHLSRTRLANVKSKTPLES